MQLRPYQEDVISKAREAISRGKRRLIIHAPTGSGKTIMAADIVASALEKNKNVIFLVHLRELAFQAVRRFTEYGIGDEVGIVMSGEESTLGRPVQVVSIQTYINRLKLVESGHVEWLLPADLIIYDEAHSSISRTRSEVLRLYKDDAVILGLTATPCRSDGRGLGALYDEIVPCSSVSELTEMGFLVPAVYYGCKEAPDLKNLPMVAGDYQQRELGERMDQARLVGNILDNWSNICPDRQTVIFATNVAHSKHIRDEFLRIGVQTEHVDAHTPSEEREEILGRFRSGDTQVVTNVGVYSEGADFPWCSCIVLARPSKSYGRYVQYGGRGLRPYPGKKDCIIIDHAGLVNEHGFIEDSVYWTLDDTDRAWKKEEPRKKEKKIHECVMCLYIFIGPKCPQCGTMVKDYIKKIATTDDELERLNRPKSKKITMEEKANFFGMAKRYASDKGYSDGWAAHKYKEKFGVWPNKFKNQPSLVPDTGFLNYVKHLNIKWARSKRNPKNEDKNAS